MPESLATIMKKLLIFLMLLTSCSEVYKTEVIEKLPDGTPIIVKEYLKKGDDFYILKNYYLNGNIRFEGKVSNDKLVEYKKFYFENGNPSKYIELEDSVELEYCCPNGNYIHYYENGIVKETYNLRNKKNEGLLLHYDTLGKKLFEINFSKGLKDGIAKKYYSNGALHSIRTYENDTLIGESHYFKENGDSLITYSVFSGVETLPIKKWLGNGQVFFADYINYDLAEFIWTDSLGRELKRVEVAWGKESEYYSDGYWLFPQ
ncbi:antitoxin component YwqK of YwqJK toxin-antitoxin module [Sediminitomix flava]|uniref:Antitoxin component YwqK of YwqJK toxin-antitoxin module n=2 Tax=Sediminitomix flava TaxID=379075 RepID=A0A315YXR5_SEDFL|nr:antitoxin component YwqK of YwqJK toxin-antitoxin module [Sediminitomix flava]